MGVKIIKLSDATNFPSKLVKNQFGPLYISFGKFEPPNSCSIPNRAKLRGFGVSLFYFMNNLNESCKSHDKIKPYK